MNSTFEVFAHCIGHSFAEKTILHNLYFKRNKPGITVVLGENGVGKSVLLKILAGVLCPTQGQITLRIGNHLYHPAQHSMARRFIGYQNEYFSYWMDYTVEELVHLVLAIKQSPYSEKVDKLFAPFHLQAVMHQPVKSLSFGYQRRLSIALSLLASPKLLLLDEPTNGLDPDEAESFLSSLHNIASHTCIIMASHRLEETEKLRAHILLLKQGHLCYDGPCPPHLTEWYHAQ